jgi:hypothetical protein
MAVYLCNPCSAWHQLETTEGKEKVQEIIDQCNQRLVKGAQSVGVHVEAGAQKDSLST